MSNKQQLHRTQFKALPLFYIPKFHPIDCQSHNMAEPSPPTRGGGQLISQRTLARFFLVIVATTIAFNVMVLFAHAPTIGLHDNEFFFHAENHMQHPTRRVNKASNNINSTSAADSSNTIQKNDIGKTEDETSVLDWFRHHEIKLTSEQEANLPTWTQIREVVGSGPVILGLENCPRYRDIVPPLERMLGSAGMFNTGTNLVTHLLKRNCEIPERREKFGPGSSKESYGMRWQVPWGKHTPGKFRLGHSTEKAKKIRKEYILPVVTIRNPYSWFVSMCNRCYEAKWDHGRTKKGGKPENCPRLKQGGTAKAPWNPVKVTYGENREDNHISLAHLWNDWYAYYLDIKKRGGGDDFPYVVVRIEDLVFYPEETTQQICECAGGKIRDDQIFQLIEISAKADSGGHDASTGIYEAWIKYSKPNKKEQFGLSEPDYANARLGLNGTLMESLGYKHPS